MNDQKLQELKANAYDLIAGIQAGQKRLNEINEMIMQRMKELELPMQANEELKVVEVPTEPKQE